MTSRPWLTTELKVVERYRNCGFYGRTGWRKACAKALGRSLNQVTYASSKLVRVKRMSAERNYKKWDSIDDETILRLVEQKWPASYCAYILGRTTAAVNRRLHKLRKTP